MKVVLYKPQTDDLDVKVAVYAFIDWGCSKNTSGCGDRSKKSKKLWPEGFDFFCKKGKEVNQVCD